MTETAKKDVIARAIEALEAAKGHVGNETPLDMEVYDQCHDAIYELRSLGDVVVVPREPVIGKRYEAGDWSRRNWEAMLDDITAAQTPPTDGEK